MCGGKEVEAQTPGLQLQKGQVLYLTPIGVELGSGFWKMDWGEGQGSQGSWTPNLPSDLYSVALRVGSALGMDGRNFL